jgi:endonuclease YncB( thermonuclease family)
MLLNKSVNVHLLARDQYQRVVGEVLFRRWRWLPIGARNASIEQIRGGHVTVYSGGEYGSQSYDDYLKAEQKGDCFGLIWLTYVARTFYVVANSYYCSEKRKERIMETWKN